MSSRARGSGSARPLRVGIDVSYWRDRTGFGRLTRELVRALLANSGGDTFILFADAETASRIQSVLSVPVVVTGNRSPAEAAMRSGARGLIELARCARSVARQRLDVFFFPTAFGYFPLLPGPACVVSVYDLITECQDDGLFRSMRTRFLWRLKLRLARMRSDLIVTISEQSRRAILASWGLPAARVRAVPAAASRVFRPRDDSTSKARAILARLGCPGNVRYLLYVGSLAPHKNLPHLLSSFQRVRRQYELDDVRLLLVGEIQEDSFHDRFPELERQAVAGDDEHASVVFAGYIDDQELVHLYNAAVALVLPSLEEGFGLPAVEALACGTPVLASRVGPLPDLVGDAGLCFDPRHPDELATALATILTREDVRRTLSQRARSRKSTTSWEGAASLLRAALHDAASGHSN